MDGRSLVRRLKERKLVQWGIGYGAGSVVLLELADILADAFGWPAPTLRVLTVLLVAGFVAALVIAWYHGERGHQRVGGAVPSRTRSKGSPVHFLDRTKGAASLSKRKEWHGR